MRNPGRSFYHMWTLVGYFTHIIRPTAITRELLIGLMWEETKFNNGKQQGSGTAQGFGQTEPEGWVHINGDAKTQYRDKGVIALSKKARDLGYAVRGLPRTVSWKADGTGRKITKATSDIADDSRGCKLACCFVRHLYESGKHGKRSRSDILKSYGTVGYAGPQPAHLKAKGGRLGKISGWIRCEEALKKLQLAESIDSVYDNQEGIIQALNEAEPFMLVRSTFEPILFPGKDEDRPAAVNPWV